MVRIAVVGAGPWGINHVRVVASEIGCTLHTVADVDATVLERVRLISPQARLHTDPDRAFADPDVDAVIIASPAHTHAALARAALAAGKHVLVEKPLAMTLPDALEVARGARGAKRIAMVGHLLVHHPAVRQLRELLDSGSLGRLHYLHSMRVNLGRIRQDENALWSFGPHDLSIIDFLLGKSPQSVAARGQSVVHRGVEDVVFMTLRYATGEMAHVHLSWLHPRKERRVTLVCSQKMVEFDDMSTEKLRVYDKGYDKPPEFTEYAQYLTLRDGDVFIPRVSMQEPLRLQLQDFIACIRTGRHPIADIDSGVRVVRILDAAQHSLKMDGVPVDVDSVASK
jgi:predicted dehydrogenase